MKELSEYILPENILRQLQTICKEQNCTLEDLGEQEQAKFFKNADYEREVRAIATALDKAWTKGKSTEGIWPNNDPLKCLAIAMWRCVSLKVACAEYLLEMDSELFESLNQKSKLTGKSLERLIYDMAEGAEANSDDDDPEDWWKMS